MDGFVLRVLISQRLVFSRRSCAGLLAALGLRWEPPHSCGGARPSGRAANNSRILAALAAGISRRRYRDSFPCIAKQCPRLKPALRTLIFRWTGRRPAPPAESRGLPPNPTSQMLREVLRICNMSAKRPALTNYESRVTSYKSRFTDFLEGKCHSFEVVTTSTQ